MTGAEVGDNGWPTPLRVELLLPGRCGRPGMIATAIWKDTPLDHGPFVATGKYRMRLIRDEAVQQVSLEIREAPQ